MASAADLKILFKPNLQKLERVVKDVIEELADAARNDDTYNSEHGERGDMVIEALEDLHANLEDLESVLDDLTTISDEDRIDDTPQQSEDDDADADAEDSANG